MHFTNILPQLQDDLAEGTMFAAPNVITNDKTIIAHFIVDINLIFFF